MLQSSAEALRPPTNTTVGDPLPLHFRYIFRPSPISTKPPKLPRSAASVTGRSSETIRETRKISRTLIGNRRFIESLGNLQSLRHYVTGPLVPNTWVKYFPA